MSVVASLHASMSLVCRTYLCVAELPLSPVAAPNPGVSTRYDVEGSECIGEEDQEPICSCLSLLTLLPVALMELAMVVVVVVMVAVVHVSVTAATVNTNFDSA